MNPENVTAEGLWGKSHLQPQGSLPKEVFIDISLPSLARDSMFSLMMDRDRLNLGEKELAEHKRMKKGRAHQCMAGQSGPFRSLSLMATAWQDSMPPM